MKKIIVLFACIGILYSTFTFSSSSGAEVPPASGAGASSASSAPSTALHAIVKCIAIKLIPYPAVDKVLSDLHTNTNPEVLLREILSGVNALHKRACKAELESTQSNLRNILLLSSLSPDERKKVGTFIRQAAETDPHVQRIEFDSTGAPLCHVPAGSSNKEIVVAMAGAYKQFQEVLEKNSSAAVPPFFGGAGSASAAAADADEPSYKHGKRKRSGSPSHPSRGVRPKVTFAQEECADEGSGDLLAIHAIAGGFDLAKTIKELTEEEKTIRASAASSVVRPILRSAAYVPTSSSVGGSSSASVAAHRSSSPSKTLVTPSLS